MWIYELDVDVAAGGSVRDSFMCDGRSHTQKINGNYNKQYYQVFFFFFLTVYFDQTLLTKHISSILWDYNGNLWLLLCLYLSFDVKWPQRVLTSPWPCSRRGENQILISHSSGSRCVTLILLWPSAVAACDHRNKNEIKTHLYSVSASTSV